MLQHRMVFIGLYRMIISPERQVLTRLKQCPDTEKFPHIMQLFVWM